MKTKILCCRNLEPEMRLAMKKCGCPWELHVLTGGYLAAPVAKAAFEEYFGEKNIEDSYKVKVLK